MLRTKQYIASHPEHHIRTHQEQQVTDYFNSIMQQNRLKEWQIIQLVDAIRLLFLVALKLRWAAHFDWDYWKHSIKSLENDHQTVARDYSDAVNSIEVFEGKPYDPKAKNKYLKDLQEVTKTLRNKNYSMST